MFEFFSLFEYSFIQRAFLAGSFTAIACATLGVFLVLRRMSLIGDGLAHISFGSIALGLFLGIYPFAVAVPVAILGSILILHLSQRTKIYGDAAIGVVSVVGVASGALFSSISGGFNVDLFSYLFGSILAIGLWEVVLSVVLSVVVLLVLIVSYWDLFALTFDEEHARVMGVQTGMYNIILAVLTAITVTISVKVVGVLLVSALLILPGLAAIQLTRRFFSTLMLALVIGLIGVIGGILISFFFNIPSGAMIVLFLAGIFGVAYFLKNE